MRKKLEAGGTVHKAAEVGAGSVEVSSGAVGPDGCALVHRCMGQCAGGPSMMLEFYGFIHA